MNLQGDGGSKGSGRGRQAPRTDRSGRRTRLVTPSSATYHRVCGTERRMRLRLRLRLQLLLLLLLLLLHIRRRCLRGIKQESVLLDESDGAGGAGGRGHGFLVVGRRRQGPNMPRGWKAGPFRRPAAARLGRRRRRSQQMRLRLQGHELMWVWMGEAAARVSTSVLATRRGRRALSGQRDHAPLLLLDVTSNRCRGGGRSSGSGSSCSAATEVTTRRRQRPDAEVNGAVATTECR